jgi:hypothetical protein
MKKQYQFVKITLSDGEVHYFGGPAVLFQGEKRTVSNVEFTEPEDLPEDLDLTPMHKLKEENNGKN